MTHVVQVPPRLDSDAFDTLVAQTAAAPEGRLLLDARHVRWADPFGMIGLLALGEHVRAVSGAPALLEPPRDARVASYLSRMGFAAEAQRVFALPRAASGRAPAGEPSPVLLPIRRVVSHEDIHGVVEVLNEGRISAILSEQLGYSPSDAMQFGVLLSELSQNVVEHADAPGWVGIQTYNYARTLGRRVAVIAVMDLGIGFRGSLAREHAARFGDRWSDATALEAAFIHGITRFRDPGRGQGLKQIRKRARLWGGKVAIRSGTARIADVPSWDSAPPMETGLAEFPGAQILIVLPAKTATPAEATSTAGAGPPRH